MSVLDTLRAATPARKSVTMCVDGALQAEWDALKDSLDDAVAEDERSGSLADIPATTNVVAQMESLRDQVKASEVTFLFEKMDWSEKIALQAAHPPREKNLPDRVRGFNVATFFPALIQASCISVTGADGDEVTDVPADVWESLLGTPATENTPARVGSLNTRQVNVLVGAATHVNDGEISVPISARSLLESQDSGASLAQPDPGQDPAPSDSKAGSQPGSATTSTTKKDRSKARSSAS